MARKGDSMRAKCKVCGTALDTKAAYKVVTNGKNAYYCSEEEYKNDSVKKEKAEADKNKVYTLICDIIGRKEILNTVLWKERAIWNKAFSDELIWQYLESNKVYLTTVISRLEDKEFNRIRYLSAILKNSLGDFKPMTQVPQRQVTIIPDEHYETKFKPKVRQSLDDLEEDCDE